MSINERSRMFNLEMHKAMSYLKIKDISKMLTYEEIEGFRHYVPAAPI